jgi:DNA-binding response OmpR family regulator
LALFWSAAARRRFVVEKGACSVEAAFLEPQSGVVPPHSKKSAKHIRILLDTMMAVLDGFEFLNRLTANKRTAGIPILALSAAARTDSISLALSLGAKDYVVKPFEPEKLLEKIKRAISAK